MRTENTPTQVGILATAASIIHGKALEIMGLD